MRLLHTIRNKLSREIKETMGMKKAQERGGYKAMRKMCSIYNIDMYKA